MYVIYTRSRRSAHLRPVAYFYDLDTAEEVQGFLTEQDENFVYVVKQMEPGDVAAEVLA